MPSFTPACSASDGHSLFVVSLTSADGSSSPSPSTNPAQTAFTRRLVLLRSQAGPASLSDVSWTIVSTYPPLTSNDNSDPFVNDLDQLVGDFTAGTSACQVDSVGNFVWLTSRSAVKTSDSPLVATISNTPKGIQYVVSSSGSGGAWSSISTYGLGGTSTYSWVDQVNKVGALFSIAPGVFVHALGSTQSANITLGLLTAGGNLVQSNQTWLIPNAGSSPKAIFFNSRTFSVLGANNNLTAIPFSQTARDVQTLVSFQQSITASQISTVAFGSMLDVCTSSQWTGVYPAVASSNVFFLCSASSVTASSQLLVLNGTVLSAPVALPATPPAAGNITSFLAVASLSDAPGGNAVVAYSVNGNFFGADANTGGLSFESGSYSVNGPSINSLIPATDKDTEKTGGIVGSVFFVIAVVVFVIWCRIRRRRKSERIAKIFEQHDHAVSPITYNGDPAVGFKPLPIPPPQQSPFAGIQIIPAPSEEEQDQAHIEMIRMQLRPAPPSIAGSFDTMVRPHAPASESLQVHEHDDYSSQTQQGSPSSTTGLIPQLTSNVSGYHDQEADHRHKKEDYHTGHYTYKSESAGSSLVPPPPYQFSGGTSSISSPSAPPLPPS